MRLSKSGYLSLTFIGHGVNEIYWFILPLLLPKILVEFDLSYMKAGGILTIYLLMVSIFSFLNGKISDLLPRWKILTTGFLVTFIGFLIASQSENLIFLLLGISLGAIGVSSFHPISYALLDGYPEKGVIFGKFEFWGMTGAFLMFIFNGYLLQFFSWRQVLLFTSLPSLAFFFIYIFVTPQNNINEKVKTTISSPTPKGKYNILLILFFLSVALRIFSILGVLNFIPTYLIKAAGIDEHLASFITGIYFLGAIIGARIGGNAGDHYGHLKILMLAMAIIGPIILLLGFLTLAWTIPVIIFLLGIFSSSTAPNQNYILSKLSTRTGRGTIFGMLVGVLTMTNAFSPLFFGLSADLFGITRTIQFFSLPVYLSLLLVAGLSKTKSYSTAFLIED